MRLKTILAVLTAFSLAGCAGLGGDSNSTAEQEDAQSAAGVEQTTEASQMTLPREVCLVRGSKHPEIERSISGGVQAAGFSATVVDGKNLPESCKFCLHYALGVKDKKLAGIIFQASLNGQTLPHALGPADEKGSLSLQKTSEYAQAYMMRLREAIEKRPQ